MRLVVRSLVIICDDVSVVITTVTTILKIVHPWIMAFSWTGWFCRLIVIVWKAPKIIFRTEWIERSREQAATRCLWAFYRAMLCIRGTSMHGPVSVCLSVRPSVTSWCSSKTAKRMITQTTPHDSPGTLVLWCQRFPRNSTGVTPYEGAECGMHEGWVKIGDFRQIAGYISKTVQDRRMVSIKVE